MNNINYNGLFSEGWICPKCGRVFSPTTSMCFFCGNNQQYNMTTNTNDYLEKNKDNQNEHTSL